MIYWTMDEANSNVSTTRRVTLNPIARRIFAEQYVKDKEEWQICAKLIRFMILSKASLFAMRKFMYKAWLEDTSLDNAFHLVFNNGKGPALMVPDQIVFEIFRLVKPEEVRLCGHFHCDQGRLEALMKNVGKSVTSLEIYRLTTEQNANWLLKRCARQLRYLACEVADLADFLRAPIQLDLYLAYHRRNVENAFSWIFKAINTKELDLGIKPFAKFPLNFDGHVCERLEVLTVVGTVQSRHEIFEFLAAIKSKAPNLAKLHMHFYCRTSDHTEWSEFLSEFIEFSIRLQACVQSVVLTITISDTNNVAPIGSKFFGHSVRTERIVNEFGHADVKAYLTGTPINLLFVAREALGFQFEDV